MTARQTSGAESRSGEPGRLIARGRTADVFEFGEGRVLKLIRPDMPAGLGDHEARAARVVDAAALPAPRLLETVTVDGRFGLVYERIQGPSMFAEIGRRPLGTPRQARAFARLHADMHCAPGDGLPDLKANLLRAIEAAGLPPSLAPAVRERLRTLPDGAAMLHGDMHPGNVIMSDAGPKVIDWMTVSRGDPAADVARSMFLLLESDIPGASGPQRAVMSVIRRWFARSYFAEYVRRSGVERGRIRAWRPVILAARLAEGIEQEREATLARLERALAS
jgi:aminoglycoside phosphotransferase (APT) family kinase protein